MGYKHIYVLQSKSYSDTYYSLVEKPVKGQSLVKPTESLVQSLVQKNADFGGFVGREGVIFFSRKIYRDHINMFLSELGYSELVQRLFEKMTFFHVVPLMTTLHPTSPPPLLIKSVDRGDHPVAPSLCVRRINAMIFLGRG
jgi:hypothetical protein